MSLLPLLVFEGGAGTDVFPPTREDHEGDAANDDGPGAPELFGRGLHAYAPFLTRSVSSHLRTAAIVTR